MDAKESKEMYLKTILLLHKENNFVRGIDIAKELDYTKASVSKALSNLKEDGYISIDDKKMIHLTKIGLEKASDVLTRFDVITQFLMKTLHIDEETANLDACRIEHVISDDVFEAMKKYK